MSNSLATICVLSSLLFLHVLLVVVKKYEHGRPDHLPIMLFVCVLVWGFPTCLMLLVYTFSLLQECK